MQRENDSDEIVTLVRYWNNGRKNKKEFNKSYRNGSDSVTPNDKDSGYEKTPYKLYGQDSINTPVDNTYMDGIINYEKNPHLRYMSDSEGSPEPKVKRPRYWSNSYESDESPPPKKYKVLENEMPPIFKRKRSDTPSDVSDDPPQGKRYKKDNISGGREDG